MHKGLNFDYEGAPVPVTIAAVRSGSTAHLRRPSSFGCHPSDVLIAMVPHLPVNSHFCGDRHPTLILTAFYSAALPLKAWSSY